MNIDMQIVDAFTEKQFGGNPAAVVITETWLSDSLMQSIAAENNLSETAFLVKTGDNRFDIRWFSPIAEVDFCGHATLASAYVIFNHHTTSKKLTIFAKTVGDLIISQNDGDSIEMDFPNRQPTPVTDIPSALLRGLSLKPVAVLRNQQAYFAVYDSENAVKKVQSDSEQLKQLAPYDVTVTAQASDYDFISRYFWPANGGDEDPVTGSIHAGLAPYWAKQLNKTTLTAYQASARGGVLQCRVTDERVFISGKVIPYLKGVIDV